MLDNNNQIELSFQEAITALKQIELILISLHKIGSYYSDKNKLDYYEETCRFIDDNQVTHRLAGIREVITEKFDLTLGDDDMDDIERSMQHLSYWAAPGDKITCVSSRVRF